MSDIAAMRQRGFKEWDRQETSDGHTTHRLMVVVVTAGAVGVGAPHQGPSTTTAGSKWTALIARAESRCPFERRVKGMRQT
jgi:hypothetical protein